MLQLSPREDIIGGAKGCKALLTIIGAMQAPLVQSRSVLVAIIGAGLLVAARYKLHHWGCSRALHRHPGRVVNKDADTHLRKQVKTFYGKLVHYRTKDQDKYNLC